ncbi:Fibronectin type III domain-containing protein [Paenibacillus sp. UNCCL117]|uniref:DUF4962 domain-containing protein n=1 Tax=unclassified Paenibacillus TaxID=185978 RepID=UPI000890B020|nr:MULTISPECIES: DUF4962 domain-containing protein [unclassified Paenibacillus]SDD04053.1 Fibronectin type III domain-containing protein [Paenibacillus sp. cl123]SFW32170.1 Fibronectin type III domain-containing protein [Paenibacillus sp. UNCCL117]
MRELKKRVSLFMVFVMAAGLLGAVPFAKPPVAQAAETWPADILSGFNMPFAPADSLVTTQNPPDFRWPAVKDADTYWLQVSRSDQFTQVPYENQSVTTNVYNFSDAFDPGTWYWRVSYHKPATGWSEWSTARKFRIEEQHVAFPVPTIERLIADVEQDHPRIWTTPDKLSDFKELKLTVGKAVYEEKLQSVPASFGQVLTEPTFPYPPSHPKDEEWNQALKVMERDALEKVNKMLDAAFFHLIADTPSTDLRDNAIEKLLSVAGWSTNGPTSYAMHDQVHRYITLASAMAYDWLYNDLSPANRTVVQSMIKSRTVTMMNAIFSSENPIQKNPYDSHGWTAMGYIGIIATALLHEIPEAEQWYRRVVPAYINIMPPWGGENGGWSQGTGYWQWSSYVGIEFMDVLLSSSGLNLYEKAYNRNQGLYPLYAFPHGTPKGIFGDDSEYLPGKPGVTIYNRLAQMNKNPILKWAAGAIGTGPSDTLNNYYFGDPSLTARPPVDLPDSKWFQDVGQVAMHSELYDPDRVSFYFKSSPYGSYNHSHADQNSFVLNAYGESLAIESGYYDAYFTNHDKNYAKQTFASNAITYDGKQGQPFNDIDADGRIYGFVTHPDFDAVSGDASGAYKGVLSKAGRNVIYVRPDKFVVIDQLQSAKPGGSELEWRLHAEDYLAIDSDQSGATILKGDAGLKVKVHAPEDVRATYEDQYLDMNGTEIKPGGNFADKKQKHAAFISPKTKSTTFITTMDAYKRGTERQEVVSENHIGYMKLRFEDGTDVYVRRTAAGEIDTGGIVFDGTAVAVKGNSVLLVDGTKVIKNGVTVIESNVPSTIAYGGDRLSVSGPQDAQISIHAPGLSRLRKDDTGADIPQGGNAADNMSLRGVHWDTSGNTLLLQVEKGQRAFKLNNAPMPQAMGNVTLQTSIDGQSGTVTMQTYSDTAGVPVHWGSLTNTAGMYLVEEAPPGLIFEKHGRPEGVYLEANAAVIVRGETGLLKLKKIGASQPAVTETWSDPDAMRSTRSISWLEAETLAAWGERQLQPFQSSFLSGGKGLGNWTQIGQWGKWTVDIPKAGTYDLVLKYTAGWNQPAGTSVGRLAMIGDQPYYFDASRTADTGTTAASWKGLRVKTGQQLEAGPVDVRMWSPGGVMNLDWIGFIEVKSDELRPSAPGGLQLTNQTDTSVSVAWNAATDNAGLKEYVLYVNGVQKKVVPSTTLSTTIDGLTPGQAYSVTIRAVDTSENESLESAGLNVTLTDGDAPVWESGAEGWAAHVFNKAVRLAWDAASDNSGQVQSYSVYRKNGGAQSTSAYAKIATVNGTSYDAAAGLQPGSTYTFKIEAADAANNESDDGPSVTVTLPASPAGGEYYESFDDMATGEMGTVPNWVVNPLMNGTMVAIQELEPGNKALKLTDNYSPSDSDYTAAPQVVRNNTPINGKVTFETRFMFNKLAHDTPIFELQLGGGGAVLLRLSSASDGTFGYYNMDTGKLVKIPGNTLNLPRDQWITLRIDVDLPADQYSITMQADAFKSYAGVVDAPGTLDKSTGMFRISDIPFKSDLGWVSSLNKFLFKTTRFTSTFLLDYVTMYQTPSIPAPGSPQLAALTETSATVSWSAPAGSAPIKEYIVYADGVRKTAVPGNTLTATLSGLVTGHSYAVTVKAVDASRNHSAESAALTVTPKDSTKPTWETADAIRIENAFPGAVRLAWDEAEDNFSLIRSYSIYQQNSPQPAFTKIATVAGRAYDVVTGLQAGSAYTFKVKATDESGNESDDGPSVTVTLPAAGSSGEYYDSFDNWQTGEAVTGQGWTIKKGTDTSVDIVELPNASGKALQLTDNYYISADEYARSPIVERITTPVGGKVVVETRFKRLQTNFGNYEWVISGGGANLIRFTGIYDGTFGYWKMKDGESAYFKIPGSSTFTLPQDQWVTLRFDADMTAKTYRITMQSEAFKTYTGTVDAPGTLDRSTGIFQIDGLPFNDGITYPTSLNKLTFNTNRFTSQMLIDYVTMYDIP